MKWLVLWWFNMLCPMFFGIGQGPSKQEQQQYGDLGALSNFATSTGEADISTADNFWRSILSGDSSQISKVLGPFISGVNKQAQQANKTQAEFGNRGGGTNASAQSRGDATRSTVDSAISSLTGTAASSLGASGSGLLSVGVSGHEAAFSEANTIQQQKAAQLNDLFKSITSVASAVFTGGKNLFSKGTPAFPNMSPGQISASFGGPSEAPTYDSSVPDSIDG